MEREMKTKNTAQKPREGKQQQKNIPVLYVRSINKRRFSCYYRNPNSLFKPMKRPGVKIYP
jgi:hypothetical protein